MSKQNSGRCARGSSRTPWSRIFRSRSTSSVLSAFLLLATIPLVAETIEIPFASVVTRDAKVLKRWQLGGSPRGLAIAADGTIYVGLAESQAVAAIDPKRGVILRTAVLDHAEIAATKELVSLRIDPSGKRLLIANGSDESATILSLPDLGVLREITLEGETVRDVVADRSGRLYVLGRRVYVYDAAGQTRLKTLEVDDPSAIAISESGTLLAVMGREDFGNVTASVAALFDTATLAEIDRQPMQTEKRIEGALFAGNDRALMAFARDALFEKPLERRVQKAMQQSDKGLRTTIDFGDLVNSEKICMPEETGPQMIVRGATAANVYYAERRCSASGSFSGTRRRVIPVSLYGVNAYSLAFDAASSTLVATDPAGFLTIYRLPRPATVQ